MTMTDKKRKLIFSNIVISCIASSMLSTALMTSLPAMVRDLNITVATGQWLTSGYSLVYGIMMPLAAFLITRFPSRKLFLSGQVIFILGLALCAIAPNFILVMIARVLQAIGGGIIGSMSQVIILSIFPLEQRGTAMGWYGLSIGAAPIIAPTLAGIIIDLFNWQTIFYIAIGIMLISLAWAALVFDNVLETAKRKFDFASFVITLFAFSGITLGIGNIGSYPMLSLQVLGMLIIGVVGSVAFVHRQLRLPTPFLDLRVLKNRNFTISLVSSMLLFMTMMGASMLLPLYVQSVLGRSATASGFIGLPGALAMTLLSPLAGKIYDKLGMRLLYIIGGVCMIASSFGMFFITMHTPLWVAAALTVLRSSAVACLMMPLVTWGTSSVSKELTAHATALLNTLRTIAGAIGISVFVGLMTSVSRGATITHGVNASMHGMNISFLCMGVVTLALLFIGVIGIKKQEIVTA